MQEKELSGIGKRSREYLTKVLSETQGVISTADVVKILNVTPRRAKNLLFSWVKGGWLFRIRRGLYTISIFGQEHLGPSVEDPWVIAAKVFAPCYIGGWSAAHHWGLTEQIYETTVVITGRHCNANIQIIGGFEFLLKLTVSKKLFGSVALMRNGAKVEVSDAARTIVDAMDAPRIVGGIRMGAEIMESYLRSDYADLDLLVEYATCLRSGAAFKRLGFLLERFMPDRIEILETCKRKMSRGYSQLDPMTPGKERMNRWRLLIPESLRREFGLND